MVAREIGRACRVNGFFYVVGHGVDTELSERLHCFSARFFALDLEDKMRIRMERGGRAWRAGGRGEAVGSFFMSMWAGGQRRARARRKSGRSASCIIVVIIIIIITTTATACASRPT